MQSGEVDEGGHEGGDLDVRSVHEGLDEDFEGGESVAVAGGQGVVGGDVGERRGGGRSGGESFVGTAGAGLRAAADDLGCFLGQVADHGAGDGELDEVIERGFALSGGRGWSSHDCGGG